MVAELSVPDPAVTDLKPCRLQILPVLPPREGGPRTVRLRMRANPPMAVRARAEELRGQRSFDAYLCVDGKRVEDEEAPIARLSIPGSRISVHLRLRGRAGGDDGDGHGGACRPSCRSH